MADPTLISDIIAPAWNALTPEERTCWHFWAASHPQLDQAGALRTLYGNQAHYKVNANVAVLESPPLLTAPPTTQTPPKQVIILSAAFPLQSQITGTTTARNGYVFLTINDEIPSDTAVIVTQAYTRRSASTKRIPRLRHVTIILPLEDGDVSLNVPRGYYATTAGNNRYASIRGITAKRRPDYALARARIINLTNGLTVSQALSNPYSGSRTKSNRARATSVNPTTGINHYP